MVPEVGEGLTLPLVPKLVSVMTICYFLSFSPLLNSPGKSYQTTKISRDLEV